MADRDQNFLTFGPLSQTAGWDLTTGPGIQPATCAVAFRADELATLTSPVDSLSFWQGTTELLNLADCHIMRSQQQGANAKIVKCRILDRRWRWQFAYIDGVYNTPTGKDGAILREKTPQQLAALLLDAMGESGYSIGRLPNIARPAVDWQSTRADQALLQLCSSLGCYPTLDYGTDAVVIYPIGQETTQTFPVGMINRSRVLQIKPKPASIRVVGGPSLFQTRLTLEPVGVDTDGKVKPVADLSYIQALDEGKLEREAPGYFGNVKGTYESAGKTLQTRELAARCVYRMYRISGQATRATVAGGAEASSWSPATLAGSAYEPQQLEDLLPLRDKKLSTHEGPSGRQFENPATVHGSFSTEGLDLDKMEDGTQYPVGGYRIDGERGIVEFSQTVFLHDKATGKFSFPELELDTSYGVSRDGVRVRWEQFINNSDSAAFGSFRHRATELVVKISEVEGDEVDNRQQIISYSTSLLASLAIPFANVADAREYELTRIRPYYIDGVIRQITWSGGGGRAATTRLSINTEHHPYLPSFETHKRRIESEQQADESDRRIGYQEAFRQ